MNAEYINLFIEAVTGVFREVAQKEIVIGAKSVKQSNVTGKNVAVIIGITGEIRGSITINMDEEYAMGIASQMMCGMPVEAFDEMAQSAIREMGNMLMGRVAALIEKKGKIIDITPPTLLMGKGLTISNQISPTLALSFNEGTQTDVLSLDIAIKEV